VVLATGKRRREANSYTLLQRHKVRELFASDAECDAQLALLQTALGGYFKRIRQIYAHYSGGNHMSPAGFWAGAYTRSRFRST